MMKLKRNKLFVLSSFLFFLFTFSISCKQNDLLTNKEESEKISLLNNDLKELNNQFVKRRVVKKAFGPGDALPPDNSPKPVTGMSFKTLCAVFSSDVAGAWAGTWAGGKLGGLIGTVTVPVFGTVTGASAGAVAGGIIVGAAASYGASSSVSDTTMTLLPMLNSPLDLPLSEQNAYDGHNRVLASLNLSSNSNAPLPINNVPLTSNGINTSIFNNINTTNNESIVILNCQDLISSTLTTFSNGQPSIDVSKSYVSNVIEDNFVTTVSNNFFDGLRLLVDKNEIIQYINSYEQYVNNTATLNQVQKQSIVTALDASKGSLAFWSPAVQ